LLFTSNSIRCSDHPKSKVWGLMNPSPCHSLLYTPTFPTPFSQTPLCQPPPGGHTIIMDATTSTDPNGVFYLAAATRTHDLDRSERRILPRRRNPHTFVHHSQFIRSERRILPRRRNPRNPPDRRILPRRRSAPPSCPRRPRSRLGVPQGHQHRRRSTPTWSCEIPICAL